MKPIVALGCLLAAGVARLAAQSIAYDGGVTASTGKYFFTERTTSFTLTSGLAVRAGRVTLRAALPVWWQNTTLVTATGAGPVPGGGPYGRDVVRDSGEARQQRKGPGGSGTGNGGGRASPLASLPRVGALTATGEPDVPVPPQAITGYELAIADPTLQAAVRLLSNSRVTLGVSAAAKVPLADTVGVGTGEWDVGVSGSLTVALSPRITAGLDGSFWHLGDLPDFAFRDPVTGSASLGALIGSRWGLLAACSAGTSALEGYDPPLWLSAGVSRYAGWGSLGLHLSVGLSESVPDAGLGLAWSIRLREGSR